MKAILLSPAVAFLAIFAVLALVSLAVSVFGYKRRGAAGSLREPYTGGERLERNQFPPEYAQFFPFAFAFIILHVAVLTVATVPSLDAGAAATAGLYVAGALLGFIILMRR